MLRIPAFLAAVVLGLPSAAALELTPLADGGPAQLTALGNEALMQGRYETAIDHYRKALAGDRSYFQALFNLALAHQQLGKREESVRWYEEALRVRPDHPEVLCNLGVLAFQGGEFQRAAERFQEAARLAAATPAEAADYWFNAGTAREALRQWSDAQRAYEEAIALDAKHFGAHYNLGTLHLGPLGESPRALELAELHLTKARDLAPDRSEVWLNLALALERRVSRGGEAEPRAAFDEAVRVARPGAAANRARWQRALYLDRCRPPDRPAMRKDLEAILADDAKFPEANGRLGAYWFACGDYDAAIRHLEREVDGEAFDPAATIDLESHYLLALIYTDHRPDPAKALSHATAYYQHHPDSQKIAELRRRALRLAAPGGTTTGAPDEAPAPKGRTEARDRDAHGAKRDDHGAKRDDRGAKVQTSTATTTAPAVGGDHGHGH